MGKALSSLMAAGDSSEPQIDYWARLEFLKAVNKCVTPAPLDKLLKLIPKWRDYLAAIEEFPEVSAAPETLTRMKNDMWTLSRSASMQTLEETEKGRLLKGKIIEWKRSSGFHAADKWIEQVAIATLIAYADGYSKKGAWFGLGAPPAARRPQLEFSLPMTFENEVDLGLGKFFRLCDAEYRKVKKKFTADFKAQHGTHRDRKYHATWTARRFAGWSFTRIANEAMTTGVGTRGAELCSRNTVRTAVRRFAGLIGLTMPTSRSRTKPKKPEE